MRRLFPSFAAFLALAFAAPALAADSDASSEQQSWAVHGQATFVVQAHPAVHSAFEGPNSLDRRGEVKETFDATAYVGFRPWSGAEIWVDPEIDQGFGLSNTLGVAGFPSGEAYKVGKAALYPKLPRWFLRTNRFVFTLGKFSVVDVFDTNEQAHDPRSDFMNWTVIDAGTFDYAANAWGYTYGAAGELYSGQWTFRAGAFDLSDVPNSERLDPTFSQLEFDGEVEHRHSIGGQPGKLKLTLYLNHGRMGRFEDAIRLSALSGQPADIAAARRMRNRTGISFNFEQQLTKSVAMFVKGGITDGNIEPYEFSDVDRTIAAGVTAKGTGWGRSDDTVGLAGVVNAITKVHQRFLDAGGLGILVGDGKLPHPGQEYIAEAYYDVALAKPVHLSLDAQFIANPAYNRDRGPVAVGGLRIHAQF